MFCFLVYLMIIFLLFIWYIEEVYVFVNNVFIVIINIIYFIIESFCLCICICWWFLFYREYGMYNRFDFFILGFFNFMDILDDFLLGIG